MSESLHEKLRKAAIVWLKRQEYDYQRREPRGGGCSIVASECVTAAGDIPDAIGWHMGSSVLVECKASRADYLVDAKKPQRLAGTGMGERRYFFTTPGVTTVAELPEGWGLIELHGKEVKVLLRAPDRKLDLAGHRDEKRLLLSLVRRIRMREFLIIQPEEIEQALNGSPLPPPPATRDETRGEQ